MLINKRELISVIAYYIISEIFIFIECFYENS